ncbi:MAG: DUF2330 domain-containing protein [Candidatus Thermoplasmatota archaeon]|jgi:hypothetical protein|nr:DUF2330 domain-containing protein [Candidatus Thermoplasmatota archaeon]
MKINLISMITLTSVLLTIIISIPNVSADGCVLHVVDYEEYITLPAQKAAIFWDGGNETMILSTKISSDGFSNMAWIIPIPSNSTPEVSEGNIEVFNLIAESFGTYEYKSYGAFSEMIIFSILTIIFLIGGILFLIISVFKRKLRTALVVFSIILLVLSFLNFILFYNSGLMAGGGEYKNVEVIEIKKVDIYDVAVLKATNASEMIDWLNENEFYVPASANITLEDYCNSPDFYFVVNKINLTNKYTTAEEIEDAKNDLKDGIATPLKIKFQPEKPFYPLKMTSINEGDTKINVYFISNYTVVDENNYLSFEKINNNIVGISQFFMDDYNIHYETISMLTFEGNTKDLTGDSYFVKNNN